MFDESLQMLQMLICVQLTLMYAAIIIAVVDETDNPNSHLVRVNDLTARLHHLQSVKRRLDEEDREEDRPDKKQKIQFDYERARLAIQADCLGPDHRFSDKQFSRVFRLTRGIVEKIIQVCCNDSPFFTQRHLVTTGEPGICPEAKVLMALKQLAFGVAGSAFMDYFQMGLTSANDSLKELAKTIANSELKERCPRRMTRADARKVSRLHEEQFGIPGCVGCLDCMHAYWRTCPTAWKGQCQGKEGKASIILEAYTDYNTWFWHEVFGPPGSCNDLNVLDGSPLVAAMVDGGMEEEIDFPFQINNQNFDQLWLMVDGIYPEISRFVKTISIPLGKAQQRCAAWQESARKSVERAFGILQRKFQILQRPVESMYAEDISNIVTTCLILHNVMVEVRINREENEREEEGFYHVEPVKETNQPTGDAVGDTAERGDAGEPGIQEHDFDVDAETRRQRRSNVPSQWPCASDPIRQEAIKNCLRKSFAERERNWETLYNMDSHCRLRDCIVNDVRKIQTGSQN